MVTGEVYYQVLDSKERHTIPGTMGTFQTRVAEQILHKELHYVVHV